MTSSPPQARPTSMRPSPATPGPRRHPGRAVALAASAVLVLAAFLPWTGDGRVALDAAATGVRALTVGLLLIAVAALPAVAAIFSDRGWPRVIAAAMSGTLVLVWLATGPDGEVTVGVAAAVAATVGWIYAAALAR